MFSLMFSCSSISFITNVTAQNLWTKCLLSTKRGRVVQSNTKFSGFKSREILQHGQVTESHRTALQRVVRATAATAAKLETWDGAAAAKVPEVWNNILIRLQFTHKPLSLKLNTL